jgi:hypothetical protein
MELGFRKTGEPPPGTRTASKAVGWLGTGEVQLTIK